MMEAGVVIGPDDLPIYWHTPAGRSGGSLPDDSKLWRVLWDAHQRGVLQGFAHTHPGSGVPGPSQEDISTFKAIELALGRPLSWWIVSSNAIVKVWVSFGPHVAGVAPGRRSIESVDLTPFKHFHFPWLEKLRQLSNY